MNATHFVVPVLCRKTNLFVVDSTCQNQGISETAEVLLTLGFGRLAPAGIVVRFDTGREQLLGRIVRELLGLTP